MWENQAMLKLSAGLMERSFNNLINLQICLQQPILSASEIRLQYVRVPPPPFFPKCMHPHTFLIKIVLLIFNFAILKYC